MDCQQCGRGEAELICDGCGSIRPPAPDLDHFQRLGLPRRFALDHTLIARHHQERLRQVHPDRWVGASAAERALALCQSAALDDALRALSEPLARLAYLLQLRGVPATTDVRRAVLEGRFTVELAEWREAAAELCQPLSQYERSTLRRALVGRFEALLIGAGRAVDAQTAAGTRAARADLARLAHLRHLLAEIEALDERQRSWRRDGWSGGLERRP